MIFSAVLPSPYIWQFSTFSICSILSTVSIIIFASIGIENILSEVLPQDKSSEVKKLQEKGIINSYFAVVDYSKLGYQYFKTDIYLKDYSQRKKIINFINKKHRAMRRSMDDMVRLCFEDFETLRLRFNDEE